MRIFLFRLLMVFVLGVPLTLLAGCATVLQETAGRVLQDRSAEDQKTDAKIHGGILDRVTGKDNKLLLDVSADVWEQRVMITGVLDDPKVHEEVVELARQDDRIREFHDHIRIVTTEEKEARRQAREAAEAGKEEEQGGAGQAVNDFWIETKIRAQLLTTKKVTSVNYFYRSVQNHVFVIGKAANSGEKDLVLNVIRETKGVQDVTGHIQVAGPA